MSDKYLFLTPDMYAVVKNGVGITIDLEKSGLIQKVEYDKIKAGLLLIAKGAQDERKRRRERRREKRLEKWDGDDIKEGGDDE